MQTERALQPGLLSPRNPINRAPTQRRRPHERGKEAQQARAAPYLRFRCCLVKKHKVRSPRDRPSIPIHGCVWSVRLRCRLRPQVYRNGDVAAVLGRGNHQIAGDNESSKGFDEKTPSAGVDPERAPTSTTGATSRICMTASPWNAVTTLRVHRRQCPGERPTFYEAFALQFEILFSIRRFGVLGHSSGIRRGARCPKD